MIDCKSRMVLVLAYGDGLHMFRKIIKRHFESFFPRERRPLQSLSKFSQEKKYIGGYIVQQYGKLDSLLFQAQATQDLRGFGSFQNISYERLVKTDKQNKNNPDGCASLSYKAKPERPFPKQKKIYIYIILITDI